jgi:DNA/RNA endonuclease G (NUC1)
MKRLMLLLILILVSFVSAQVSDKPIRWQTTYINGVYSERLEQPLMVEYIVLCTDGNVSRSGMSFYKDSIIHTSDDADYINNVWDKGHLAPAANFKCDSVAMWSTFTYLNCALQHERLNRGIWKSLEVHERNLSKEDDLRIYVHVDFAPVPNRVAGGAAIPIGFYKEIIMIDKKRRECYWFPNKAPDSKKYKDYECECRN